MRSSSKPFVGAPSAALRPGVLLNETILETAEAFADEADDKRRPERAQPPRAEEAPTNRRKRDLKSIDDLKRPHVNLMGVIPPRATSAVDELNVVMVGEPALPDERAGGSDDDNGEDVFDSGLYRTIYGIRPSYPATPLTDGDFGGSGGKSPKPAILAQTGTQQKLTFSQRPTAANKGEPGHK